ncbi:hypothetical protein MNL04_06855 [Bartonella krasnovii]|uniref:hypothetical protein n=1 Tax=Bartonella krasnovii TaxID=2267275 RepID=UPI001F4D344D|nr:hypothetical protein [Bartonella krasnovii]UNF48411.1 hypothetical protein MNL04_06855 [Bartonella krasnovii]
MTFPVDLPKGILQGGIFQGGMLGGGWGRCVLIAVGRGLWAGGCGQGAVGRGLWAGGLCARGLCARGMGFECRGSLYETLEAIARAVGLI